jgi:hypothetical protein
MTFLPLGYSKYWIHVIFFIRRVKDMKFNQLGHWGLRVPIFSCECGFDREACSEQMGISAWSDLQGLLRRILSPG